MLQIQRWKTYSDSDLRAEGLSDREIRAIQERKIGSFRPAYVDGKRRFSREGDKESFYERMSRLQSDLQAVKG